MQIGGKEGVKKGCCSVEKGCRKGVQRGGIKEVGLVI